MRRRAPLAVLALLAAEAASAAPATAAPASPAPAAPAAAAPAAGAAEGQTVERHALPGGGAREIVYRGGLRTEERVLDPLGALLEEYLYGPSAPAEALVPIESRKYLRSKAGRLERVEARDSNGTLVGSLDYRYDRSGRLLGVSSSGSFGPGSAGMISAGGPPQGAWIAAAASTTVSSYDGRGRPLVLKTIRDGEAVLVEKCSYGEGPFPIRVEVEDLASGALAAVDNDEAGRPLLRKDSIRGRETSRTSYRYDGNGRLVEEAAREAAGGFVSRTLSYGEDGSLAREETRKDGLIMSAVEYVAGGRIEELYRGGELFVKATYSAGRKVKDEFYSGGKVLREKEYK